MLALCLVVETAMAIAYGIGAAFASKTGAISPDAALGVAGPSAESAAVVRPRAPVYLPPEAVPMILIISSLCAAGVMTAFALAGGATILRLFRKTATNEILFFGVALAALSLEALRPAALLARHVGAPLIIASLLTRSVLFGRWAGAFGLFGASVYAAGLEYGKSGQTLAAGIFLALILSASSPLDSGSFTPAFLVRVGFPELVEGVAVAMAALSVLGYLIAARRMGSRDYAWMGAGIAAMTLGRETLQRLVDPALCALGAIALGAGIYLYTKRQFRKSLWG